ncbi:MAG: Eco57I restriction-modification methylase domain-containing protein [candidate division NC10 bacterium]|nr:Eco57I restriction-modification methylase domain-containing protein [candidate division NC10 bacterium]
MDDAKAKISDLIEKFQREQRGGNISEYNESETKAGFIEPLLQALGWDTRDRNEVGFETKVSGGRVDYSLKLQGTPRIYVEAKPLKADLAKPDIVTQAITYGYNTKAVKWVLLTDFQELRLFDVTLKPTRRNLERGLRLQLPCTDYLNRFDELWLLSKSSVETGALDRTLLPKRAERDRLPVDRAILEDLTRWQEILAKDLYKQSGYSLEADRLREATQRILDRIVFIRSCEDRKLTHAERLRDLVDQRREEIGTNFGLVLKGLFRRYDRDFNSDLFAPHFSEDLAVDFMVLKEIILGTYEPYLFDVVGVHLLGSIYEQYLGYTINLTEKRVKYEPKPQVRKAGGVYYTPEYIVEYIVKNSIGRLLREKGKARTAKQKNLPLRVLDMACGSGSFLIRAYDELYRHYETMKAASLKRRAETLKAARADQFAFPLASEAEEMLPRLTIFEKRQMVLDHLFGVDIDPQACEVARLSLMLKMLEDEYGIVPGRAILPTLDYNVQCGNSLISGDVLKLQSFFRDDWIRTKPFDWEVHFQKIMQEGGFDVIIGNPPYVRIQTLARDQVAFFNQHYAVATGNYDIYVLFVEQALKLLKPGGILGFILPHKFFQAAYGKGLRKVIADQKCLMEVVNFRDNQVFEGSSTYTCLLFLQKDGAKSFKYAEVSKLLDPEKQLEMVLQKDVFKDENLQVGKIKSTQITQDPWSFSYEGEASLMQKIKAAGRPLSELTDRMFQGIRTSANEVYVLENRKLSKDAGLFYSKALDQEVELESDLLYPFLRGTQIRRYEIQPGNSSVLFPYKLKERVADLIKERDFKTQYQKAWDYLQLNKKLLQDREDGKMKGAGWYAYGRSQNLDLIGIPRIVTRDIVDRLSFALDADGTHAFVSGYGISLRDTTYSLKYILALLNSRLVDFYFKKISTPLRGGFYRTFPQFLGQLPIRLIDFSDSSEKKLYDDLVALVDVMLALRRRIQQTVGAEKEQLQRQIEKTDREINSLVYGLYGLTKQEQAIVETQR